MGATAFVGLLEGGGGISSNVMLKTAFGWIFTLIATGFMSALLMVLGIRTPNVRSTNSINAIEHSVVLGGHEAASDIASRCPKSPALEVRYHGVFLHWLLSLSYDGYNACSICVYGGV